MSEQLTETANEHVALAERYAAELIDGLGMPTSYERAVTMVAVAYLKGQCVQLQQARNMVRGDAE